MCWEIIFVLSVLIAAMISFIWGKYPIDLTAIVVFATLLTVSTLTQSDKLPSLEQLLDVFSNHAPITIAAMFIMSFALDKCGAIEILAVFLNQMTRLPYPIFVAMMVLGVASISAFINNTPVVVVFLPIVINLARKINTPASKLLIPLSYASIFGGVCTLMGTSTNILMSGIVEQNGYEPLSMFELAHIGVPLLFLGTLYLSLFGKKILPTRETLTSILSEEERREFITEAFIKTNSRLVGQCFLDFVLMKKTRGVRLLEIIRDGVALKGNLSKIAFKEGDRLVLACRPSGLVSARAPMDIDVLGERGLDIEQIAAHEGSLVEGVIGPKSTITGKTFLKINFRQRYRMIVLAVHRNGRNVREKLEELPLQFGDTLLMMGTDRAIEELRRSDDIILLDRPAIPSEDMRSKMPIVLTAVIGIVVAVSFQLIPIVTASLVAVAFLLLTGTIQPKDIYKTIEWRIVILIFGMLALGNALQSAGVTSLAAKYLIDFSHKFPSHCQPFVLLVGLYLLTALLTEILSNNATIVLIAPIALNIACFLQVSSRPFIIAACIASSASFVTPIGYQTNTYVHGVGGYRFTDFARVGIPLSLLYFLASMAIIPWVWPF